jgi:hypothetical protein
MGARRIKLQHGRATAAAEEAAKPKRQSRAEFEQSLRAKLEAKSDEELLSIRVVKPARFVG